MIDLVIWSFLAALFLPIVLHVCVRILSVAAGLLEWRDDRPSIESSHSLYVSDIRDRAAGEFHASPIMGGVRGPRFPEIAFPFRPTAVIRTGPPSRPWIGKKI